jgi:hypothetical protein
MRPVRILVAATCAVLPLVAPSAAFGAEPPDRNDPCSQAGRDTCGTLGVGFYKEYRYGIRWFGDFRGVVAGTRRAFCLDLRYWYASPDHRYRPAPSGLLRNRDGEAVPIQRQQKIAYAIWRYGRSTNANRQAAVALYVHSLMGDARPGEIDPAALDGTVASLVKRIERDSSRFHGPYRVETRLPNGLVVGKKAAATIRVLSATGAALPSVRLAVSGRGATGLPGQVLTNSSGVARIALTPTVAGRLRLSVESAPVASTLPRIFRATRAPASANAQRLAAPSSQRVSARTDTSVLAKPSVSTVVSDQVVRPGARIFDRIRIRGLGRTAAKIRVELYGPFATRAAIRCGGRPYWATTITAKGDAEISSPSVKVAKAGFYGYRERLIGSPLVRQTTTDCPLAEETSLATPRILAGGADATTEGVTHTVVPSTPTRVRLAAVGIDAAVSPVAIDLASGGLGLPHDIRRAGWWKDGMAPGATAGAILISGHVDSARAGAGAFFSLRRAQTGQRVQVRIGNGRTFSYRIVSLRSYRKDALPTSIYSVKGRPRLVLVTCGGPFDAAKGSYRDNIVVTAVPTR